MTEFSDKLKQLRESKGWSKTNVAKHLGIGLSTYANWEYGISEPDIQTINQIATLYDVSNGYLMGRFIWFLLIFNDVQYLKTLKIMFSPILCF